MQIPLYWSKATAAEADRDGKTRSFSCWRWSDSSPQEAHESALATAQKILQSLLSGATLDRYAYGLRVLREDVKQRFKGEDGQLTAAITQNAYGALILNTAGVMFIDLDFSPVSLSEALRYAIRRWFDKSAVSPDARQEQATCARVDRFLADRPQWHVRIYRTFAGLRVMATHALFDPASDTTRELLENIGADPMYVRLCQAQNSFRARLTPKPWRCGHVSNTISWPRESADEQRRFDAWMNVYLERQANFATCRYLAEAGSGIKLPVVETMIEIHDRTTRCHEVLDLA